jgi:hypothetical protein
MLSTQNIAKNATEGKEIIHKLIDLESKLSSNTISEQTLQIIPQFLFGIFHIKLSIIWNSCFKVLSSFIDLYFNLFWNNFSSTLELLLNPKIKLQTNNKNKNDNEITNDNEIKNLFFEEISKNYDISTSTNNSTFFILLIKSLQFVSSFKLLQNNYDFMANLFIQVLENKNLFSFNKKEKIEITIAFLQLFSKFKKVSQYKKSQDILTLLQR